MLFEFGRHFKDCPLGPFGPFGPFGNETIWHAIRTLPHVVAGTVSPWSKASRVQLKPKRKVMDT